jgi:hypothetical protein
MQTAQLMREIQRLPTALKLQVVEETIRLIKKEGLKQQMGAAAAELLDDYAHDRELTAFTALDLEGFYETR